MTASVNSVHSCLNFVVAGEPILCLQFSFLVLLLMSLALQRRIPLHSLSQICHQVHQIVLRTVARIQLPHVIVAFAS